MKTLFVAAVIAAMVPAGFALAQQPSPTAPSGMQAGGDMEPGVKGSDVHKSMDEMANHMKRMRRHHIMDRRHLHVKDKHPAKNQFQ